MNCKQGEKEIDLEMSSKGVINRDFAYVTAEIRRLKRRVQVFEELEEARRQQRKRARQYQERQKRIQMEIKERVRIEERERKNKERNAEAKGKSQL